MCHTSPATFLVWGAISVILGSFLVFHLWSFDRFKCIKWNSGPSNGAFKRIMTYSYLCSVPLIMTYSLGFAAIKYKEGYVQAAFVGIVPKPYTLWDNTSRRFIFPLMLLFSVGWSLEMVTHLEELCFWLFLVNAASAQQDWFKSLYFKTWVTGSLCAVLYMPLVTIFTRDNPLKSEGYTFLAGSLGSMCLTIWFLPVLWMFPSFLANLKREGVDSSTVVRLTKFHELNTIRVVFRFLFVAPLLVLGADGVKPHKHEINESIFWTDVLAIVAAFGCAISSALTLVIFFPRSIEGELAARDQRKWTKSLKHTLTQHSRPSMTESRPNSMFSDNLSLAPSRNAETKETYPPSSYPTSATHMAPNERGLTYGGGDGLVSPVSSWKPFSDEGDEDEQADVAGHLPRLPNLRPNRRKDSDVELGGISSVSGSGDTTPRSFQRRARMSNLNPLVHNFTSPIDLGGVATPSNGSRLTFTRPS